MNRDEIMLLSPAELREAIARKKGWKIVNFATDQYWCAGGSIGSISDTIEKALNLEMEKTGQVCNWPSNIAEAWRLVEEIRAHGDEIRLDTDRTGGGADIFTVVVLRFRGDNSGGTGWTQIVNVEAPTAPLAISRAWLMWREEK